MPVYKVLYQVNHIGHYGPELISQKSHHVLLVDAASRVMAFAVAYDHLTKQGLAVSVNLFDPYKGNIHYAGISEEEAAHRRQLNALGFKDEDLDQLVKLGVPIGKSGADTTVVDISEHHVTASGSVLSTE